MNQTRRRNLANGNLVENSRVSALWKKSLTVDATWENKDDFLDVVYWMRQIFAIFNGILWGFIPVQGLLGIGIFLAINCLIVYIYSTKYQNIDEDDYGGIQEILKEGLFTAFAVFVVCWILVYTATYNHTNI